MSANSTRLRQFKIECQPENARRFWDWIKNRGGVAKWKSINLSNPGASWSSPANSKEPCLNCQGVGLLAGVTCVICKGSKTEPYKKPNWQCGNVPEITTDPKEVGVFSKKLYRAFNVGVRMAGLGTKLTDAAQRKLDACLRACEAKHGDSFYERGTWAEGVSEDRPSMGVFYTEKIIPLDEWIAINGEGQPEVD